MKKLNVSQIIFFCRSDNILNIQFLKILILLIFINPYLFVGSDTYLKVFCIIRTDLVLSTGKYRKRDQVFF